MSKNLIGIMTGILIVLMTMLFSPTAVFAEDNNDYTGVPVEIVSAEVTELSDDSWTVECIIKNIADIDLRYVDICAFVCNEDGGIMNAPSATTDEIIEPGQTATLVFSGTEPNAAYLQFYNYFYTFVDETTYNGEFDEDDAIVIDFIDNEDSEGQSVAEESIETTLEQDDQGIDLSDFLYVQNEDEVHIKSYTGSNPNVIIPSEIDGGVVTIIENGAFSENQEIQSVTFPNTIKDIGENAFFNCINLKNVKFPVERTDSLTIGPNAFSYCNITGEIVINSSYLDIGYGAFNGNNNLSDFIILSDDIRFGDFVFSFCSSMKFVYLKPSASVVYVGAFGNSKEGDVFANLNSLEAAYLPRNCDFLTEYTFENTPNVVIYVPEDSDIVDYATELWLPTNTADYDEKTAEILDELSSLGYDLSETEFTDYIAEEPSPEESLTDDFKTKESVTESASTEIPENEEPIQEEAEIENNTETEIVHDESIDGQPLTRDDFIVELENVEGNSEFIDKLAMYDNDISLYLDAVYRDGGYVFFNIERDIEDIEVSDLSLYGSTYRGIIPDESSKEDVLNAYGLGIDYNYVMESDPIYERMADSGEQDLLAYILEHYVAEVMVYTYKNQYQIAFYLDATGDVITIVYTNWVAYEADKATVLFVQGMLNKIGYACGDTDGIAGPITSAAVKEYQEDNDLFVSGVIDDELLKSLNSEEGNSVEDRSVSESEIGAADSGADYSLLMGSYLDDATEDSSLWSYLGEDNLLPTPDTCLKGVNLLMQEDNVYIYAPDEQNEETLNEITAAYSLMLMLDCGFTIDPAEEISGESDGIYLNGGLIALISKIEDPDLGPCLGIAIME